MYQRRGNSQLARAEDGEEIYPGERYATPPTTPIPVVWEITGLAKTVYHLRRALLDDDPGLERRIKELHTAWKDEVITIREYWEGLQELRVYSQ